MNKAEYWEYRCRLAEHLLQSVIPLIADRLEPIIETDAIEASILMSEYANNLESAFKPDYSAYATYQEHKEFVIQHNKYNREV
jgi:hypothetical protein